MTWADYHRRDEALRRVTELADRRRDGLLPWAELPEAADVFGTTEDLLRLLQMRWHTRLAGAVEATLTEQPADLERAVVYAWRCAASGMPGVRAILDANVDHAAIAVGRRNDHAMLAAASGRCGLYDPQALPIGRQIEARASAIKVQPAVPLQRGTRGSRLSRRLRHLRARAA